MAGGLLARKIVCRKSCYITYETDGNGVSSSHLDVCLNLCQKQLHFYFLPFAVYEVSSSGASKNYQGEVMGRFEFVPGVEKEGSPVYKQAQSKEVPSDKDYLLYRWKDRFGNGWVIVQEPLPEGVFANLRARVEDDPTFPPTTGWKFENCDIDKFDEDPHLTCSSVMSASSSCCITVSLSGLAKEFQGECEGEYRDTGLRSMGRKVIIPPI